jgi:hypothetical protein
MEIMILSGSTDMHQLKNTPRSYQMKIFSSTSKVPSLNIAEIRHHIASIN